MADVAIRDGLTLSYSVAGPEEGPALVLITGLGGQQEGWFRQIPYFRQQYRVIAFDNRGAGRSGALDVPTTMADFADDTARLLDHLGVAQAHVWGVSMGGKIAQELALSRPDRVLRVVLENTSAGEAHRVEGPVESRLQNAATLDEDGWLTQIVPALFGRAYRERNEASMRAFARSRARNPPHPIGSRRQWEAYAAFDSWDRLPRMAHETLVIAGDEDAMTDPQNAEKLASRLPSAGTYLVRGAGHSLHIEAPDETNRVVDAFLSGGLAAVPDQPR